MPGNRVRAVFSEQNRYGAARLFTPWITPTSRTRLPITSAMSPTPSNPRRPSSVSSATTAPGSLSSRRSFRRQLAHGTQRVVLQRRAGHGTQLGAPVLPVDDDHADDVRLDLHHLRLDGDAGQPALGDGPAEIDAEVHRVADPEVRAAVVDRGRGQGELPDEQAALEQDQHGAERDRNDARQEAL